jgi:pyruvate dehydrogenase E2 component (dihydrolipoamide acetyltransferase)
VTRVAVEMPRLGYDMEAGKIAAWTKKVGDRVERGDVIAEIETDKSTIEMESMHAGTLSEIVHAAGAEVAVGQTIAWLDDDF